MELREKLDEYKRLLKIAEKLAIELDDARDASPKSPRIDGLPRSGKQTTLDLQMEIIESAEKRFEKARERALKQLAEIEDLIDSLPDREMQRVLYFRHVYTMKWMDVADRMHCCERTAQRIHRKALEEMCK